MSKFNKELDNRFNYIKNFEQLDFSSAQKLYIEYKESNDSNKRKRLIEGTLYVVYNHIKNNGLKYLNSNIYDIDDIIDSFVETWIEYIDSGVLLKVQSLSTIFISGFYSKLTEKLIGSKPYSVLENFHVDFFTKLLYEYIFYKNSNYNITFLEYIKGKDDLKEFCSRFNYYYKDSNALKLVEAVYESCVCDNDDFYMSYTQLGKLIYLLVSNAEERIRFDLKNVVCNEDDILNNFVYLEQCKKFIINSKVLTELEKEFLRNLYGLDGYEQKSGDELAILYNVTPQNISRKHSQILRHIRNSSVIKNVK